MEEVMKRMIGKKGVVAHVYNKVYLTTLIRKKQQEIKDIEEQIENNTKTYEFLEEDERQIAQMNLEMNSAATIISVLEQELECLLRTPIRERDTEAFAFKSNQLYDMVQQQDLLRSNRQTFFKNYEANVHNYNAKRHDLCHKLDELQNELSALQQKT